MSPGAVVFRQTGGPADIDAIDEYSRRLVAALATVDVRAVYHPDGPASLLGLCAVPDWVLLQYNPFRYGRTGIAPGLVRDVVRLRRRWRVPLAVMVHEAWIDMRDPKSAAIGLWQRAQLRAILRCADLVLTSTEALAVAIGGRAMHVPVAANIGFAGNSRRVARAELGLSEQFVVTLFGRNHESRALDYASQAMVALSDTLGAERLVILNLGADAPEVAGPAGVTVVRPGRLPADELSLRLSASDLVLLPLRDGVSTRRGTLMSALAHGRPVLGLRGVNTDSVLVRARDALALTPVGDRVGFARAAVELAGNRVRRQAMGSAARHLYRSQFDWPVLASNVAAALERL